ncbi:2-oxo acid dehydrogenase subunit E2 [Brevibacterium casei]|nr:2-oxo acid dehydrogenase subunit E2 [Brevibacterium casei]
MCGGTRDSIVDTVGKASTGKFAASELSGGTFTLNNYGVFGVDGSAPIINLPEVAMLGLGRIKDRPWVVDGELTVRKVMYLSFVFDHRACDGAEPSEFLTFVADCIENPISLLPEV